MNEITPCRTPQRNHEIGTCYSGLAAFARSISGHRPSALGLLLQHRRALEVLRSVHVHEPSSLLTFDLMGISMWRSMEMSIEISIGCPWRCPSERTGSRGGGLGSADALLG